METAKKTLETNPFEKKILLKKWNKETQGKNRHQKHMMQ